MTAKEIYKQTKKFPMRLLLINMAVAVVSIILACIIGGLGALFKSSGIIMGGVLVGIIVYAVGSSIVQNYIGYMFKYGSIHAIMKACTTGQISQTYFEDSVEYVKNGFLKANIYMVVDKLINQAVRGVTKLVNAVIGFLPDNIKNFVNTFINIYLDYVDECCLAYSMMHPTENVAKTSCDGIVLYYQNAKNFLAPAFKTSIRVVVTNFLIVLSGFVFLFFWPLAIAWWLFGFAIVGPFLRHRVLCNVMVEYISYAQTAQVQTDLYDRLSTVRAFQNLRDRINNADFNPAPGNPVNTQSAMNQMRRSGQSNSIPTPSQSRIPEPQTQAPTQEQMMWQQAWGRMNDSQRRQYNSMQPEQQIAWKRQILKTLFNYDLP